MGESGWGPKIGRIERCCPGCRGGRRGWCRGGRAVGGPGRGPGAQSCGPGEAVADALTELSGRASGRAGGWEHGPGAAPHPHRCCPIPQAGPAGLPQAGRAAAAAMRRQAAGRGALRPGHEEKRVSGSARPGPLNGVQSPTPWPTLSLSPPQSGDPFPSSECHSCAGCTPPPEPLKPQLTVQTSPQTRNPFPIWIPPHHCELTMLSGTPVHSESSVEVWNPCPNPQTAAVCIRAQARPGRPGHPESHSNIWISFFTWDPAPGSKGLFPSQFLPPLKDPLLPRCCISSYPRPPRSLSLFWPVSPSSLVSFWVWWPHFILGFLLWLFRVFLGVFSLCLSVSPLFGLFCLCAHLSWFICDPPSPNSSGFLSLFEGLSLWSPLPLIPASALG